MKVSVIVPFHGEEKYIEDCLLSLEEQTEKDFEVIVVCDRCSPESVSKLKNRETSLAMKIIELEKTGVAAARNAGLEAAEGEYVLFLDCDDYLKPRAVEVFLAAAEEKDIVFSRKRKTWYGRTFFNDKYKKEDDGSQEEEEEEDEEEDDGDDGDDGDERDDAEENDAEEDDGYGDDGGGVHVRPWISFFRKMFHNANQIQSVSVLGMFFRRSFLESRNLRFEESFIYTVDLTFVLRAFCSSEAIREVKARVYIQRNHNDPINLPAMSQIPDPKVRVMEMMKAYLLAEPLVEQADEEKKAKITLDQKFIKYYATRIARYYIGGSAQDCEEIHREALKCLQRISPEAARRCRRYTRKLLRFSMEGQPAEIGKMVRRHSSFQTLGRLVKSRAACKKYLYRKVFARMKMVPDMVVFESFFGRNYSDSPKYIYEYLGKHYPGRYKFVWILNERQKEKMPFPCKRAKRFSLKYYYYMARAKYHVFNGRQPVYFIKRKGNVFLETWHGTPLKKLVFDMDEVTTASPLYKKQFYTQTRSWDYLVAPNQFSEDIFRHAFMYDGKMLETGYPRNDILYLKDKEKDDLTSEIKRELGIPENKKVILYAPTWRDDEFYDHAQYKFTLKLDMAKMQKEIGGEYVLLLRTHYFVVDFLDLTPYQGFAWNVSRYNDIARLYLVSDVLITDYSSVFFDYANLRRPMLFFTYDLDKYQSVLRGFYMDVEEELPGPMLFDTDEVLDAIRNLPRIEEKYREKYKVFCDKYCGWEDGTASEKVIKTVFGK